MGRATTVWHIILWKNIKRIQVGLGGHAFFLIIGGFTLHERGKPMQVLEARDLEELPEAGKIKWPTITKEEIADWSKGDYSQDHSPPSNNMVHWTVHHLRSIQAIHDWVGGGYYHGLPLLLGLLIIFGGTNPSMHAVPSECSFSKVMLGKKILVHKLFSQQKSLLKKWRERRWLPSSPAHSHNFESSQQIHPWSTPSQH